LIEKYPVKQATAEDSPENLFKKPCKFISVYEANPGHFHIISILSLRTKDLRGNPA